MRSIAGWAWATASVLLVLALTIPAIGLFAFDDRVIGFASQVCAAVLTFVAGLVLVRGRRDP